MNIAKPASLAGILVVRNVLDVVLIRSTRGVHLDIISARHGVELGIPACDHYALMVALGSSGRLLCETRSGLQEMSCRAGDLIVVPIGSSAKLSGSVPPFLRVGIDADRVKATSPLIGSLSAGDEAWSTVFAHDMFALHMGGTIFEETIKPEAERRTEILHHLAEAFCAHLVTNYGLHHSAGPEATLGETEAIRRVVERLKRKTHDFPDLASMAEMAGLSRFHFSRIFKAETGLSPVQFVERCRIEQAKILIEAADLSLSDIAVRLGFSDQSHFTKRFAKIVGSTPAAFARTHARRRHLPD